MGLRLHQLLGRSLMTLWVIIELNINTTMSLAYVVSYLAVEADASSISPPRGGGQGPLAALVLICLIEIKVTCSFHISITTTEKLESKKFG